MLKRLLRLLFGTPTCAACEGKAETDWHVSATGGVYGLCAHCAERRRQIEAV